LRDLTSAATCANGEWTIPGPFTLAGKTMSIQYDKVKITGSFSVAATGVLAFTYSAPTDTAHVEVTGAATIDGTLRVDILSTDTTSKTLNLLSASTLSVPLLSSLKAFT